MLKDVYANNTFKNTKFTISSAALSTDQAKVPGALHSEAQSCVGMSNCSKSIAPHQPHDHQNLDFLRQP